MINNDVTNTTTTKTLSVIDSSDNEMEIDLRISSTSTNLFDKNNALNSNLINVHQPPPLSSTKSQLSWITYNEDMLVQMPMEQVQFIDMAIRMINNNWKT